MRRYVGFSNTKKYFSVSYYDRKYSCKECDHVETFEKEDTTKDALIKMVAHLQQAHKVAVCQHCNTLLARSSLRKHQGTDECKCGALSNQLLADGYTDFDVHQFTNYFNQKLWLLVRDSDQGTYWNHGEEMFGKALHSTAPPPWYSLNPEVDFAKQESRRVFHKIRAFLDVRKEPTSFTKGGWGRENTVYHNIWAREEPLSILQLVNNLNPLVNNLNPDNGVFYRGLWNDETVSVLCDYIDANPEQREAMRGTLELAADARNF